MPAPPFAVPSPVLDWIRNVFAEVNRRSAAALTRIPTTFETTLDHGVIAHLAEYAAPFKFLSDWIVTFDTHYLGGGRYWGSWEIADIGMLVVFRRGGVVVGTKIALLQSKRLYPDEIENAVDMHPLDYGVGFGRLLASEGEYRAQVKPRLFHFSQQSRYRALEYREEQYQAIVEYGAKNSIPVYCLLYNPLDIPSTAALPATAEQKNEAGKARVACRVMKADTLDAKLAAAGLKKAQHPAFASVAGTTADFDEDFWTLHNFVADLVIECKEGYTAGTNPTEDQGLFRVFNQRSGPISAAISITIDALGGAG